MGSNDDMLARLHSRSNGFQPEGQEPVDCGLQGLSQGQVFGLVVGIPPVTAWESGVILAPLQFCMCNSEV